MYAIIETGGKQYQVSEGDVIYIEKLDVEDGSAYTFESVIALVDGENTTFGTPTIDGASVSATVVSMVKGKKVRIFKYKAKKGYRRRQGHRQPYSKVEIGKINA